MRHFLALLLLSTFTAIDPPVETVYTLRGTIKSSLFGGIAGTDTFFDRLHLWQYQEDGGDFYFEDFGLRGGWFLNKTGTKFVTYLDADAYDQEQSKFWTEMYQEGNPGCQITFKTVRWKGTGKFTKYGTLKFTATQRTVVTCVGTTYVEPGEHKDIMKLKLIGG